MPRYDAACGKCGLEVEVVAKDTRAFPRCECGGRLEWIPGVNVATFKPFIHPHLGHKPVEIRSWGQYKEELKKRGLKNELAS